MRNFAALLCLMVLGSTACQSTGPGDDRPTIARFFLETPEGAGATITLPHSGVHVAIAAKPVFTEFDVVRVEVVEGELGKCLRFEFTMPAARDLYRLTALNQGRRLVLTINGAPVGARRIGRPFDDGTVQIFVETPDGALPGLAEALHKTARGLQQAALK